MILHILGGREHRFPLSVTDSMPFTQQTSLIVYYVSSMGETVVDTQNVDVETCLPNQVLIENYNG